MNRTALSSLIVATALLVSSGSVAALTCAPPDPFDMGEAIDGADAAAVGTITSISVLGGEHLVLSVRVDEVYRGTMDSHLLLERFTTPWGPHYGEGDEIALLSTDGVVDDGRNQLCGPNYSAQDMREVGGEPTFVEPPSPLQRMFQAFMDIIRLVVLLLTL